jgi:hypothetical protein
MPEKATHLPLESNVVPWEIELVSRIPGPASVASLLVVLSLLTAFAGYQSIAGNPLWSEAGDGLHPASRGAVAFSIIIGYALWSFWALSRYAARETAAFIAETQTAAAAPTDIDLPSWSASIVRKSRHAGALGLVGACLAAAVLHFVFDGLSAGWEGAFLLVALALWLMGRAGYLTIAAEGGTAEVLPDAAHIDLLNLAPLQRLGRIGLRTALTWIGGLSLYALLESVFPFSSAVYAWYAVLVPFFTLTLVVATLGLLIPVRGVRARVRQAKQVALAQIDSDLRVVRNAVVEDGSRKPGLVLDLLAYRSFVEGVREWPFDSGTRIRFLVYTLIPVGSWLGGALVERLVDTVLG